MTILGKLSCLQEAFIYIIVQTVSLKKKLHNCHSWVLKRVSLFSILCEIFWAAFWFFC